MIFVLLQCQILFKCGRLLLEVKHILCVITVIVLILPARIKKHYLILLSTFKRVFCYDSFFCKTSSNHGNRMVFLCLIFDSIEKLMPFLDTVYIFSIFCVAFVNAFNIRSHRKRNANSEIRVQFFKVRISRNNKTWSSICN